MPNLNLDPDYFDHPKTRRLVGLLGRGAETLPMRLWCYCAKYHRRDGSLGDCAPPEIESIAGWWGDEGAAVEAMVRVGFLEKTREGIFRVHDWKEHAGHLEKYARSAAVAAKVRWDKHKTALRTGMRTALRTGMPEQVIRNAPAGQGRAGQGIEEKRDLVGVPPTSDPEIPKGAENGAIVAFRIAWKERYRAEAGPSGKDCIAANVALRRFPPEERDRIVRAFVADDDAWLVERAHRLGFLPGQLDRIRAKMNGRLGVAVDDEVAKRKAREKVKGDEIDLVRSERARDRSEMLAQMTPEARQAFLLRDAATEAALEKEEGSRCR